MRWRNALRFRDSILLTVHTETGPPFSLRVRTGRMVWFFALLLTGVSILFLGTLLFFREMESTRNLEARVLQLELEARLQKDLANLPVVKKRDKVRETQNPDIPLRVISNEREAKAKKPEKTLESTKAALVTLPPRPKFARAKIAKVSATAENGTCKIKVTLKRRKKGSEKVKGSTVVALKSMDAGKNQIRFQIYPGNKVSSSFAKRNLLKTRGNRFQFSNVLPLFVNFKQSPEFEPKEVIVYLLDSEGQLISEQRSPVVVKKAPPPKLEPQPEVAEPTTPEVSDDE